MSKNQIFSLHPNQRIKRLPQNKLVQNWFKKWYKDFIWVSFHDGDVVEINGFEFSGSFGISTFDVLGELVERKEYDSDEDCLVTLPGSGVFTLLIESSEESLMFGVKIN